MRAGVVSLLSFLICLAVLADCARDFFMHNGESAGDVLFIDELENLSENEASPDEASLNDYCRPCLEISKKAQSFLKDPTLHSQIDDVVGAFCQLVPSDYESQCKEKADGLKRRAISFLQEEVLEEKFCNTTGFCPGKAQGSSLLATGKAELHSALEHLNEALTKLEKSLMPREGAASYLKSKLPLKLGSNNATCSLCISVLGRVRNQLDDPDKQLKIITSLIKACETEAFSTQCKKLVFAYGPMFISSAQRVVSMDLCHILHFCEEPKNRTVSAHGKLW